MAVDRLEELAASRSRAAAVDVRTEMVADTATRFDALKAQVSVSTTLGGSVAHSSRGGLSAAVRVLGGRGSLAPALKCRPSFKASMVMTLIGEWAGSQAGLAVDRRGAQNEGLAVPFAQIAQRGTLSRHLRHPGPPTTLHVPTTHRDNTCGNCLCRENEPILVSHAAWRIASAHTDRGCLL